MEIKQEAIGNEQESWLEKLAAIPIIRALFWCGAVLVLGNLPDIIAFGVIKTHTISLDSPSFQQVADSTYNPMNALESTKKLQTADSLNATSNTSKKEFDIYNHVFKPEIICAFSLCLLSAVIIDILFFTNKRKNLSLPAIFILFLCYIGCFTPLLFAKCNILHNSNLINTSYVLLTIATVVSVMSKRHLFDIERLLETKNT